MFPFSQDGKPVTKDYNPFLCSPEDLESSYTRCRLAGVPVDLVKPNVILPEVQFIPRMIANARLLMVADRLIIPISCSESQKEYIFIICDPELIALKIYASASAYQLLNYKDIDSNPNDGRSTTQDNLADDLHTNEDGTPFTGWWESTLEDWTGCNWHPVWGPTESNLLSYTCIDVDLNWPLIYDTKMNSTNGYLPGYSSGTIYHYVTGDGYGRDDQNVWWIHYVDPNRYRSAAYGAHWVTNNKMWKVVRSRGVVY